MGLVITRKLHESVRIGDSITVEIGKIAGEAVRLNITAPPDVQITRTEIIGTGRDSPKNHDKDVAHGNERHERGRLSSRGSGGSESTGRIGRADDGDEPGEFCDE